MRITEYKQSIHENKVLKQNMDLGGMSGDKVLTNNENILAHEYMVRLYLYESEWFRLLAPMLAYCPKRVQSVNMKLARSRDLFNESLYRAKGTLSSMQLDHYRALIGTFDELTQVQSEFEKICNLSASNSDYNGKFQQYGKKASGVNK